jgi:hypothetical protein
MGKHEKYYAKHHHWEDGILNTLKHFFDTVEEAIEHATESEAHVIKIYDTNGELVHSAISSITPEERSTYA